MRNQMEKLKNNVMKVADNRIFCMIWLFIGVGYITWFNSLAVTYLGESFGRFVKTASVISMVHPKLYILWVVFIIVSLWLNVSYMYRHNDYNGKAGRAFLYLSFISIIVTKVIPHEDDFNWRMVVHWGAALTFAFFCTGTVIIFLASKAKKSKRHLITLISYVALIVLMLIWLVVFEENGAIETLPIWATYLILYLVNFTNVYKQKPKDKKALT